MKYKIAKICDILFVNLFIRFISGLIYGKNHIRVINYHGTPESYAANLSMHLQYYAKRYSNVNYDDLESFFNNRKWHKSKPGLIISFDDGLKSNYNVAIPLLEKYEFTGWFCIPFDFINTSPDKQSLFMRQNSISEVPELTKDRMAMNWEELNDLKKKHVIICHTKSHYRMNETDSAETLHDEIVNSKKMLEEKLCMPVNIFCWVGGETESYTKEAVNTIKKAQYKYSFMTNNYPILPDTQPLEIQRTNIESSDTIQTVKFYLSGIYDLYYFNKRKKVLEITS